MVPETAKGKGGARRAVIGVARGVGGRGKGDGGWGWGRGDGYKDDISNQIKSVGVHCFQIGEMVEGLVGWRWMGRWVGWLVWWWGHWVISSYHVI